MCQSREFYGFYGSMYANANDKHREQPLRARGMRARGGRGPVGPAHAVCFEYQPSCILVCGIDVKSFSFNL